MNIFPSTLFISASDSLIYSQIERICQQLDNIIKPNNPDIFIIDQNSGWNINITRTVKNWLSQKPFNHQNKIVIIYQADQFNLESQNALLKSLEEPGNNNYFILTSSKPSKIISTITSRCQIIKLKNDFLLQPKSDLITFDNQLKNNLAKSEAIGKDKDQILTFLEHQLQLYQQLLATNPTKKNSHTIQKILKAIQMIEVNVDPRSSLDFLFLS